MPEETVNELRQVAERSIHKVDNRTVCCHIMLSPGERVEPGHSFVGPKEESYIIETIERVEVFDNGQAAVRFTGFQVGGKR